MNLIEEVKKILRANYKTDNTDELDIGCETEEEFTDRVAQQICQLLEPYPDAVWSDQKEPCYWCRTPTHWLDTVYGGRVCSQRCQNEIAEDVKMPSEPKPDEGRLLTNREILLAKGVPEVSIHSGHIKNWLVATERKVAKAQRDLTASIQEEHIAHLVSDVIALEEKVKEKDAEFERKCQECEYDPEAARFGWFIDKGWLPPEQAKVERAKMEAKCQQRVEEAIDIIGDLIDADGCSFDHHGYCQAHGYLNEGECPNSRAKKYLKFSRRE